MWKNEIMPPFLDHLKNYNETVMKLTGDPSRTVSLFGLDLYSLHRSADEVLRYLNRVDPQGAKSARKRFVTAFRAPCDPSHGKTADTIALRDSEKTQLATRMRRSSDCQRFVSFSPFWTVTPSCNGPSRTVIKRLSRTCISYYAIISGISQNSTPSMDSMSILLRSNSWRN